jgi:NTE family protein
MQTLRTIGSATNAEAAWVRSALPPAAEWYGFEPPVRIGLALGGGFARGIAHAGVLKVLEQHHIPIHCITGISAGAVVAAAYASGAGVEAIAAAGRSMRFGNVGRLSLGRLGLVDSQCMNRFLGQLLKTDRFEAMRTPLGIVATDLTSGEPISFAGNGAVFDAIRASCAYPGLFEPVQHVGRLLVDGAMSMGVPAALARQLGATHVISVHLPTGVPESAPSNMFQVLSRCFQIMQSRFEESWRRETDLVITPVVEGVDWNAFGRGPELIEAGETAARAAVSEIESWLRRPALTVN